MDSLKESFIKGCLKNNIKEKTQLKFLKKLKSLLVMDLIKVTQQLMRLFHIKLHGVKLIIQ